MRKYRNNIVFLPREVLAHVASFLGSKDALNLMQLSSFLRGAFSLSTLHDPTPLSVPGILHGTNDGNKQTPRRSVWIPILFPQRTLSVVVTCRWQVHGYGNKGKLYVVAVPSNDDLNEAVLARMENGTIVYESPQAPREEETLTFSFSHSVDKSYYLWYSSGNGGRSHQFRVKNLLMHTIVRDCPYQFTGQHHRALSSHGFLNNPNDLGLRMIHTLASVAQESMTPETTGHLLFLFGSTGLNMSAPSLRALQELATALTERNAKKLIRVAPDHVSDVNRGNGPQIVVPVPNLRRHLPPAVVPVPVDDAPPDDVAPMQLVAPVDQAPNENRFDDLLRLQLPPIHVDNVEMPDAELPLDDLLSIGDDVLFDILMNENEQEEDMLWA